MAKSLEQTVDFGQFLLLTKAAKSCLTKRAFSSQLRCDRRNLSNNALIVLFQYTIPGPITLRRGDAVYVRAENGKNLIAQIDTMWTAPE